MNVPPGLPLSVCPACGCRELFVRKDFPQKVGLLIVVIAAAAFLVLSARRATVWLGAGVLLAAVVVDAILFCVVGRVTVCYRCRREFREMPVNPAHSGFELAIAEKYKSDTTNEVNKGAK